MRNKRAVFAANWKSIREFLANGILFLSGWILVMDFAPSDWSAKTVGRKQAVAKLIQSQSHIICSEEHPAPNVNITGSVFDREGFRLLVEVIRQHSSYAEEIPWDRAVCVGHKTINMVMAPIKKGMPTFNQLFVAVLPEDLSRAPELDAIPVGTLSDLDKWLREDHLRKVNLWAGALLVIGFGLQLIGTGSFLVLVGRGSAQLSSKTR